LAYVCARNRQQSYNLVIGVMKESGISQATLARRLGKAPEVVSRLLSRPRNWEQDTLSELVFAITGGGISYSIELPRAGGEPMRVDPWVELRSSDDAQPPDMNFEPHASSENNRPLEVVDLKKKKGPIRPMLSFATG